VIWNIQLVFDCADPLDLSLYWGHKLEQPWLSSMDRAALQEWLKDYPQYEGRGRIDDEQNAQIPIYIQRVPEPKVGRNRIRLELGSPGAATTGELYDVEGNEYSTVDASDLAFRTITIDALDPDRLFEFWQIATDYEEKDGRLEFVRGRVFMKDGWIVMDGRQIWEPWWPNKGDRELFVLTPGITFAKTDEPKTRKNRLHLDIRTTELEAHRDRLVKLGATVQRWDTDRVLLDPEGNEFCL
jgi:hypothetical protein